MLAFTMDFYRPKRGAELASIRRDNIDLDFSPTRGWYYRVFEGPDKVNRADVSYGKTCYFDIYQLGRCDICFELLKYILKILPDEDDSIYESIFLFLHPTSKKDVCGFFFC